MKKIVILTTYRTGSTAFCDALSKKYNLKNLDEHFHEARSPRYHEYFKITDFVMKIMPDQIVEPHFSKLIPKCIVYGLYRKDLIKQIASYYLALGRDEWHIKKDTSTCNYELHLDHPHQKYLMWVAVNHIQNSNRNYEKLFRPLVTKEYIYEDIRRTYLKNSDFDIYNKPKNYKEILHRIERLVEGNTAI